RRAGDPLRERGEAPPHDRVPEEEGGEGRRATRDVTGARSISFLVPVYNESGTVAEVARRLGAVELGPIEKELLLVDDGSSDGSRFLGGPHRVLYFWHHVGNRLVTLLSNALTNYDCSDVEVGYKAFRREVLASLGLRSERFGIEPEIAARLARGRHRLYEVPI